jgi:hypothetical protein
VRGNNSGMIDILNSAHTVRLNCTDGSTVMVNHFAAFFLADIFGIDTVKAVNSNGKRYLYTPVIPDPNPLNAYRGGALAPRRWPFADFLARHVYFLHRHLPGDGRIIHNGSDSFLPTDYTREEFERLPLESEPEPRPVVAREPKVPAGVIQQQLGWLGESLMRKSLAKAAKKLNRDIAADVVHEVVVELLETINSGLCEKTTEEDFKNWVLGAVNNRCCDVAGAGCCNGSVLPDPLEVRLKKDGILRGEFPEKHFEEQSFSNN